MIPIIVVDFINRVVIGDDVGFYRVRNRRIPDLVQADDIALLYSVSVI